LRAGFRQLPGTARFRRPEGFFSRRVDDLVPLPREQWATLRMRLSILEYLHKRMGEKCRPCPLLAQSVKAGRLGKQVGRGVYEY
jgi:3-hydroxyacyl-CoA dehydrogenase, C-terminal domain